MEQQLLNYVEQESKRGVPEHMVKKALRDAGWSDIQINEAFEAIQSRVTPPAPEAGTFLKDEAAFGGEDESSAEPASKTKKPVIIAVLVFVALAVTVAGLIFYYNYSSTPREELEPKEQIAVEETEPEDAPSAGEKITEPPVPAENNNEPVIASQANPDAGAATSTLAVADDPAADEAAVRDNQRMADMKELVLAQKKWFAKEKSYYTCGLAGGDCKGKPYGYPLQIGAALEKTPLDPLAAQFGEKKLVCGKNYVYCGLNNAPYPQFFCYYAKLEGGGYYTASHEGSFKRSTPPKIFEECAVAN